MQCVVEKNAARQDSTTCLFKHVDSTLVYTSNLAIIYFRLLEDTAIVLRETHVKGLPRDGTKPYPTINTISGI